MYGHPLTPPKPRWKSKTYWFNLLITALAGSEMYLQVLQPLLGVNVYAVLTFLLTVGNLVLREATVAPVGKIPPSPPPEVPYPAPPEPDA
jgi:hypothetical protein